MITLKIRSEISGPCGRSKEEPFVPHSVIKNDKVYVYHRPKSVVVFYLKLCPLYAKRGK